MKKLSVGGRRLSVAAGWSCHPAAGTGLSTLSQTTDNGKQTTANRLPPTTILTLLLALVWALVNVGAYAQSTGQLRFRLEPPQGVSYVLDGKYRMTDREVTLLEGAHRFTFWAPERRMLDTTFFVIAGRLQEFTVQLRYAPEYIAYRDDVVRYERRQKWGRTGPLVVAAGTGAFAAVSYLRYRASYNDLQDLREEYRTSSDPESIRKLKAERIPEARDDFAKARTQAIISGGVFAVSLGAAAYLRHRIARSERPVFEDKERIRFEGLVHAPSPRGGTWAAGISVPLR